MRMRFHPWSCKVDLQAQEIKGCYFTAAQPMLHSRIVKRNQSFEYPDAVRSVPQNVYKVLILDPFAS